MKRADFRHEKTGTQADLLPMGDLATGEGECVTHDIDGQRNYHAFGRTGPRRNFAPQSAERSCRPRVTGIPSGKYLGFLSEDRERT